MLKEGFSADETIKMIREKRSPNALCNPHFVRFINEVYEEEYKPQALSA